MKLNIGKVILELRKRDGVTQEKLAQALGVSVAAVSKWETGSTYPDITVLPALARYFKTTVDNLMGYEETCSEEQLAEMIHTSKALFAEGKVDEGIEKCEDYMRQYPTNLILKFCVATCYVFNNGAVADDEMQSKWLKQRAIQLLEACTQSEDKEIQNGSYLVLGGLYIQDKVYDKAKHVVMQLPRLQRDPDIMLATILLAEGDLSGVKQLGSMMLMRNWENVMNAFGLLAIERSENNDCERALGILEKQNKLMDLMEWDVPSRLQNKFNTLQVYMKARRMEGVIKTLEETIKEVARVKQIQEKSEKNVAAGTIDLGMDALRYMVTLALQTMRENENWTWVTSDKAFMGLINQLEKMV